MNLWEKRAKNYSKLEWTSNDTLMEQFIDFICINPGDRILDVGCGDGKLTYILQYWSDDIVIGIDNSKNMIKKCKKTYQHMNNSYVIKDALDMKYNNDFHKVIIRMVLHEMTDDEIEITLFNIYKSLKEKGEIFICEGTPPSMRVKQDYIDIFKIKEDRQTFFKRDLVKHLKKAGFKNIKSKRIVTHNMSIKNWLENSGLPKESQKNIYKLHKYAEPYFKKAYNMTETKDDILCDWHWLFIKGEK